MAQCAVRLRKHPTKKSTSSRQKFLLTKDIGKITAQDISDTIAQTFVCAVEEQEKLDNPPTNIVLNNRPGLKLVTIRGSGAQSLIYKASAYFGRPDEMRDAAIEAYRLLRVITRIQTGPDKKDPVAKNNFHVFVGKVGADGPGKYLGQGSTGLFAISRELTSESTVSIVGPLTTYGRKLYWNPSNNKTIKKRFANTKAVRKELKLSIRGGFIGTDTMHSQVKKKMRRQAKWKAFSISDPFYIISPRRIVGSGIQTMKRPLRMPAITVQVKKGGRIR